MTARCRRRGGALLILVVPMAGVGVAGCAGTPAPARADTGTPQPVTYVYVCPDGYRFSARTRDDSAVLALPERSLTLLRVVSASGVKYEARGAAFSTKGEQASLATGATQHRECDGIRAGTPWEEAALLGIEFRAIGQEPGWTLDLDQGRWMRFIGDYGKTHVLMPAPVPVRDTALGIATYSARADAHTLVLSAREAPCRYARCIFDSPSRGAT